MSTSVSPLAFPTRFSLERPGARGSTSANDDPLAHVLRPPPDESPDARAQRIVQEEDAVNRSRAIDEQLASDRKVFEERKRAVKVLLLGQSESGKTTTLKNFQRTFAPNQFHAERNAWRAVIQLNLIASVRVIVDALQAELAESASSSTSPPTRAASPNPVPAQFSSATAASSSLARARAARPPSRSQAASSPSAAATSPGNDNAPILLTPEHRKLILRLGALLQVEASLASTISPSGCLSSYSCSPTSSASSPTNPSSPSSPDSPTRTNTMREFFVRAGDAWKHAASTGKERNVNGGTTLLSNASSENLGGYSPSQLSFIGTHRPHLPFPLSAPIIDATCQPSSSETPTYSRSQQPERTQLEEHDREHGTDGATSVLAACLEDVVSLWSDPVVRAVLKRRKMDIESYPGFFLDDTDRIAQSGYEPSDDDILKARLQTLGVEEHYLKMEVRTSVSDARRDWVLIDINGHRSTRHKWIPYFENIDAIIFLAPLVFTQTLVEDPTMSRVEDSLNLWKVICAHPLLARTTIVLFLNKMDLVQRALERGVKLKDYVPSFGEQKNDLMTVVKYFRSKFKAYQRSLSPALRVFYCHQTSVIDSKSTSAILLAVREGIMFQNLQDAHVL